MDSTEAAELLMSGLNGINKWNQLRSLGKPVPMELTFDCNYLIDDVLDLRGVDLGGCSLQGSNLSGADLTGSHLYRTNFINVDLSRAILTGAHLVEANLSGTRLSQTNFERADLREAILCGANGSARFTQARMDRVDMSGGNFDNSDFSGATMVDSLLEKVSAQGAHFIATDLRRSNLSWSIFQSSEYSFGKGKTRIDRADLSQAILNNTNMSYAVLTGANLSGADLTNANFTLAVLEEVRMIKTILSGTTLTGSSVYGISAWDLCIDEHTVQGDLNISKIGETAISVDDLEVAQFMYMLMNNAGLRRVIDTITSKVVLVLGRFSETRKPVLDAIRVALREQKFDLVPIVFDFDKPASRTTAETVATLAGMARFVIADLSDAKSVLQELGKIVPSMPSLPVQSLIVDSQEEPGMLDFFQHYPWFLKVQRYSGLPDLLERLDDIIAPAMSMSKQIRNQV
jgi:uncharacterized protein YjbI with pentapeptide repeats